MKGLILISAYNSETSLPYVLQELKSYPDIDILVVNDGSDDNTAQIAKDLGVHVISHPKNFGKGAAIKTGLSYASQHAYDFLITMDADNQHPASFIPEFIKEFSYHPKAVILGRRHRDKNMPWTRKFSNSVSAAFISWRIRQKIYDVQCGYRLIPAIYFNWTLSDINGFIYESEVLIAWAKNRVKFRFVPIPTVYPQSGQSKMTYFDTTFGFIFMYISSFFKSYKQE